MREGGRGIVLGEGALPYSQAAANEHVEYVHSGGREIAWWHRQPVAIASWASMRCQTFLRELYIYIHEADVPEPRSRFHCHQPPEDYKAWAQ